MRILPILLAILAAHAPAPAAAAERPSIVLIMADDFGYECVGANGGTSYATPHLNRLAANGMRFEHCYSQPLCTPTRVQLMTGQSNVRNYDRFGWLDPKQTTFAQLFRQAGYATCIIGKWQLGHGFEGPSQFGFDDHCLWQLTRRPPRYANPGLEVAGQERDYRGGEYGPDLVCDYAIDFMRRHRDEPFLVYYPMILTHSPYQPTPDSPEWDPSAMGEKVGKKQKHFGDMVQYADKLVGRITASLEELGLGERTLVLFLGDNGTGRGVKSLMGDIVVEGGKGQMTDAGTRVPLIAHWPGTIPAGQVSRDLIDTTDFLPTLCQAAGVPLPQGVTLDGRSFLPQLRGEKGAPREWIYCWYAPNQGRVNEPREFARNHEYRLFRDGTFSRVDSKHYTEEPLDAKRLSPTAAAARKQLQAVLDMYADARPQHPGSE